ncbi:MAG: hypothetical protein ACFE8C_09355 [Promethearchaeota archaeon]
MKDFEKFRYLNQIEKNIINTSLIKISSNITPVLKDIENLLYILIHKQTSQKRYPIIFLFSKELDNLLNNLNNYEIITSGGLYFGFIKRGEFYLSLEGAEFLYEKGVIPNSRLLYVSESGEKSVLYGNNILKKMLINKSYRFKAKDFLFIVNKSDEIIAIGQSQAESKFIQNLKPTDLIAINLSDKGMYLREHQ